MRLLLDEQYSPTIAQQLRTQGFDVVAVVERPDLIGLDDEALLRVAAGERRALLTNNVRHFTPIARDWGASGQTHYGLLFTSDASLPRSRETIGVYVEGLAALLEAEPADDSLRDQVRWLSYCASSRSTRRRST